MCGTFTRILLLLLLLLLLLIFLLLVLVRAMLGDSFLIPCRRKGSNLPHDVTSGSRFATD